MPKIVRPAVQIQQGHLTLYLTYVTPNDLGIDNFYDVEHLEPRRGGYQRILNQTRANRLSRHLADGYPSGYANLPTTIFLATDKEISFNADTNRIEFETEEVCPFRVVDGQHRIAGLIKSAEQNKGLSDFKLPATIATSLDDTHQMYHFYIVNTTQQAVETALQQQITSRFTDMQGVENLPYLPHWLEARILRGTDAQSLRLAEFLNDSPDSPLRNRIQMANDPNNKGKVIKQASIVTTFKENIFTGTNPIVIRELDSSKRNHIILNYFRSVDSLFVEDGNQDKTIVYKTNGLFFFTVISKWVFTSMYARGLDFTIDSITSTIRGALQEMDEPYASMWDPDWWLPGGGASTLNRAAVRGYSQEFLQALTRSETAEG